MGKDSRRPRRSKRKRSVTVTVEEMTAKMQEDVNDFKERHKNRRFKDGKLIQWALVLSPEEWETNEEGKVLAKFLNYDPKERHDGTKLIWAWASNNGTGITLTNLTLQQF